MRDQWRAGDDHRDINRRRNRGTDDRRKISPAAPRETDVGLKIKGRAAVDSAPESPSEIKRSERENELGNDRARGSSRSPPRRRPRDEELVQRPRESSRDRYSKRSRNRDEGNQTDRRRRTRSRSPQRELLFGFREERRRPRSPIHSGRTDTFRPSSRRRERAISPPRSNRGDHYSSTYTDSSGAAGRFGDSYIPGPRPRSRSPPTAFPKPRHTSPHPRPRSKDRPPRSRRTSPERQRPKRRSSPGRGSKKECESTASSYRPLPRSGTSPKRQKESSRYQNQSLSPSRGGLRKPGKRRRSPRSPVEREGGRGGRTKMQPSTRPIQNTINDGSRPPSPPRPIPSYEPVPHNPAMISEAFPLHGMKASDVHGTHRPGRPPHLNTQQSYSTSPQWTPTSSHHNSPHSGSPFSQGRGGWGGQQQQYHGQPG